MQSVLNCQNQTKFLIIENRLKFSKTNMSRQSKSSSRSHSHSKSRSMERNIRSAHCRYKLNIPLSYSRYKKQIYLQNPKNGLHRTPKQNADQSSDSSDILQAFNGNKLKEAELNLNLDLSGSDGPNSNATLKQEIQKANLKKILQRQIRKQKELSETILQRQKNCEQLKSVNEHIAKENKIIRKYIKENQVYKADKKKKLQRLQLQLRKVQGEMAKRKHFTLKWQQENKEIHLKQIKHLRQDIKRFEVFFDGLRQSIDILKGNPRLDLNNGNSLAELWQNWKTIIEINIVKKKV